MEQLLVADGSLAVRTNVRRWLERHRFDVVTAATGEEALAGTTTLPDLALLDLALPDLSGVEVMLPLRREETRLCVPIVILTAWTGRADLIACLEAGAEDFLAKPVDEAELIARLRSLLRAKRLLDRLLMSCLKLDRLGEYADSFTLQSQAKWKATEVATGMACHLLGRSSGDANRPRFAWAGQVVKRRVVGASWFFEGREWRQHMPLCPCEDLEKELAPDGRGGGRFLVRLPMPPPWPTSCVSPPPFPRSTLSSFGGSTGS